MSAKDLLDEITQKKNINYELLTKELKVSMQTLYTFRRGSTKNVSISMVKKLAEYLGEDPSIIAYKALANREASKCLDENSLMYLCKRYCSGLAMDIRSRENHLMFCGLHYKKRTGNSYSLVDGWKNLELQFWKNQYKIDDPDPKEIFLNEDVYYQAILQYGISKVLYVNDKKIINYEIIFQDETLYRKVKKLLPARTGFNVNLILEPVDASLSFDQVVSIDNDDILFFEKIYQYVHKWYFRSKKEVSNELWIAAFECNKAIVPFVQPNIEYASARLIRKKDYLKILTEEDRKKSPQEQLVQYLEKKVHYLRNGEQEKVDLNYSEYQYVLRPIDATINQGKLSLEKYKMIMEILKPLIEDYYHNES